MDIKVSVIVPVYNAERYLAACVDSVLQQDYHNIELILVDDGSSDNSQNICKSYTDNRVMYIHKENGGVSSARNLGIEVSGGGYLMFVDSDDYLPKNAISSLVTNLEETKADIVTGGHQFLYGNKLIPHFGRLNLGIYATNELLPSFIDDGTLSGFLLGSVWGGIYKADIVKNNHILFDPAIKNNEDGLFNFEYVIHSDKLSVIEDQVYVYRQYAESSCSKRQPDYDYNKQIIERIDAIDWDKDANRFEEQVKSRNVSLALWDILLYPKGMSFTEGRRYISNRIRQPEVQEGLKYINFKKTPKYKKVFVYLIKFKSSIVLYLIVKHIYPILNSRLRR